MIALQIQDVKLFMSSLLAHEMFDRFLVYEMDIQMGVSHHLDGKIQREWYTAEEQEEIGQRQYEKWQEIRPIAYQWIRGKKTPLSFKIVFLLDEKEMNQVVASCGTQYAVEGIQSMLFTVKFEGGKLSIITGTSMKTFTMDKTLENQWDHTMQQFLHKQQIAYEQL